MYVSWKTASALVVLALVGAGGCAAGEDATGDDTTLAAPEADEAQVPAQPPAHQHRHHTSAGNVDVTVNVNEIGSNDRTGYACGHHHHAGQAAPPPAPPPLPAPPPPSASPPPPAPPPPTPT